MKYLILLLLFGYQLTLTSSCASKHVPSWVSGLRSGEERLVIKMGRDSTLFRRLASTCEHASIMAEQDAQKAGYSSFNTELVYKDELGCAITLNASKDGFVAPKSLSQVALENAVLGRRKKEFEKLVKDEVELEINYKNRCWQAFDRSGASYHGTTVVCWRLGAIVGYCLQEGCYNAR
jgi:hypothetical protein